MEDLISSIKSDLNHVIKNISTTNLVKILKYACDKYYNEDAILTDEEYDKLYDLLKNKSPKNKFFNQIGCDVSSKKKVKLPYHMGSMDKFKPTTDDLDKWLKKYKGPFVITDKLDGVSGLFVNSNNNKKLYTRGNGTYGTDISILIPFIKTLNQEFSSDIVIRGEFIISKTNFNKNKNKYSNARAMVNGLINQKNPNKDDFKIVDFITYEYIKENYKISKQLKYIKQFNLDMVNAIRVNSIDNKNLSELLKLRKEKSSYDIDGLVIYDDNEHAKNVKGNPKYAFAFKDVSIQETADVEVVRVEWNISKDGLLKPRIEIKPVKLSGVQITFLSGFNAKYIIDNKIGKNTILKIIRSGDVIPHILEILKSTKADLPNMKYKFTDSKVDIIVDESNKDIDKTRLIKNLTYFFKTMEIKNIDAKLIEKIIDINLNTIPKILKAKSNDFLKIEGIKETMATKIYENIQKAIIDVKITKLMTASNIFGQGFGIKKFDAILKAEPDILKKNLSKSNIIDLIIKIDGFEEKTATKFAVGLPKFKSFLKTVPMIKIKSATKISSEKLKDIKIVFSGFRDKELEESIENQGGKVVSTISSNTNYLIVKDKNETSSKITKAKNLNIKIITKEEFIKMHHL